ncbi:hypothetical protein [Deinococcus sp. ME38]|uniref:hypothetical protein n=1 Tax=Deinococcus sp. ME38 TaxID=3400344 RepID=UPI003B599FA6
MASKQHEGVISPTSPAQLGDYLTAELAARGLTVQDLASQAGMNYEVVRSAVRAKASPSWENVSRMLRPLGLCLGIVPIVLPEASTPAEVSPADSV